MIFRIFFSPFPRSAGQAAERGKTKSADAEVFTTLQTIPPDFLVFVLAESEIVISRFRPRFQRDRLETEKAINPVKRACPVKCEAYLTGVNPVEYKTVISAFLAYS